MKTKKLKEKEFDSVIQEFTKRYYCDPRYVVGGFTKKVYHFFGKNLPDIFILRHKDGSAQNSLMIHPQTPLHLISFELVDNNRLFGHSNVSPFPKIAGGSPNYYRALFGSPLELGKILDNLIEIGIDQYEEINSSTLNTVKKRFESSKKGEARTSTTEEAFADIETIVRCEGNKKLVFTYQYERDPKLRAAAIKAFGYKCSACGIDFEKVYGQIGKQFIELHHIVPVSDGCAENNYKNLLPLCPNCHRMIHRLYRELKPSEYSNAINLLKSRLRK